MATQAVVGGHGEHYKMQRAARDKHEHAMEVAHEHGLHEIAGHHASAALQHGMQMHYHGKNMGMVGHSEENLVPSVDTEIDMTKEEMKASFAEAIAEAINPLKEELAAAKADVDRFKALSEREFIEAFVETHRKPNKNGEVRIMADEMDATSGL